jgi:hypothetical protein
MKSPRPSNLTTTARQSINTTLLLIYIALSNLETHLQTPSSLQLTSITISTTHQDSWVLQSLAYTIRLTPLVLLVETVIPLSA